MPFEESIKNFKFQFVACEYYCAHSIGNDGEEVYTPRFRFLWSSNSFACDEDTPPRCFERLPVAKKIFFCNLEEFVGTFSSSLVIIKKVGEFTHRDKQGIDTPCLLKCETTEESIELLSKCHVSFCL